MILKVFSNQAILLFYMMIVLTTASSYCEAVFKMFSDWET